MSTKTEMIYSIIGFILAIVISSLSITTSILTPAQVIFTSGVCLIFLSSILLKKFSWLVCIFLLAGFLIGSLFINQYYIHPYYSLISGRHIPSQIPTTSGYKLTFINDASFITFSSNSSISPNFVYDRFNDVCAAPITPIGNPSEVQFIAISTCCEAKGFKCRSSESVGELISGVVLRQDLFKDYLKNKMAVSLQMLTTIYKINFSKNLVYVYPTDDRFTTVNEFATNWFWWSGIGSLVGIIILACIMALGYSGIIYNVLEKQGECTDKYNKIYTHYAVYMEGLIEATAGSVSATIATYLTYPIDTVKTILNASIDSEFRGVYDKLKSENGFYKGVEAKVFQSSLQKFIYYYIYGYVKSVILRLNSTKQLSFQQNLFIAYTSALLSVFILTPIELVQTRLQINDQKNDKISGIQIATDIINKNGISGLFRGIDTNIALCINPAIEITCFDRLKIAYSSTNNTSLSSPIAFVLGAIAKAIATILTFPIVRMKVLKQSTQFQHMSNIDICRKIVFKTYTSCYSGVSLQLIKGVLNSAFLLMFKEKLDNPVRVFMQRLLYSLLLNRRRSVMSMT